MGIQKLDLKKAALWMAIILVLPTLVGCTGSMGMALKASQTSVDTRTKSVAIFTLLVKNDFRQPAFGLGPSDVIVESKQSDTKSHFILEGDWQGKGPTNSLFYDDTSEAPVSLALPPGKYTIGPVMGGGATPLLYWQFNFRVDAGFDLPPNSVVYLGHVVMSNRERKGDEERSGPINPLLAQSLSGLNNGTMDITVTDQSSVDIPKFLAKYPCLRGVTVKTAIMTKIKE